MLWRWDRIYKLCGVHTVLHKYHGFLPTENICALFLKSKDSDPATMKHLSTRG